MPTNFRAVLTPTRRIAFTVVPRVTEISSFFGAPISSGNTTEAASSSGGIIADVSTPQSWGNFNQELLAASSALSSSNLLPDDYCVDPLHPSISTAVGTSTSASSSSSSMPIQQDAVAVDDLYLVWF